MEIKDVMQKLKLVAFNEGACFEVDSIKIVGDEVVINEPVVKGVKVVKNKKS